MSTKRAGSTNRGVLKPTKSINKEIKSVDRRVKIEDEESDEDIGDEERSPPRRLAIKPGKALRENEMVISTRQKPKKKIKDISDDFYKVIINPKAQMYPNISEKETRKMIELAFAPSQIPEVDEYEPDYVKDTRVKIEKKIRKLIKAEKIPNVSEAKIVAYARMLAQEILFGTEYNSRFVKELDVIKKNM